MYRMNSLLVALTAATLTTMTARADAQATAGQSHAYDPSKRLEEVLPGDVAQRVLYQIAQARSRGLPTQALERTALKGAARQVPPAEIERAVDAQAHRLGRASEALSQAAGRRPSGDEIEAGAEAMRLGVDAEALTVLAKTAPADRPIAVSLHVLGSLVSRGLPSDAALAALVERLSARATDAQIAQLPEQVSTPPAGKPDATGRELAGTRRPGTAGAPAGVPANAGAVARPTVPKPSTPTGRP